MPSEVKDFLKVGVWVLITIMVFAIALGTVTPEETPSIEETEGCFPAVLPGTYGCETSPNGC